MSRFLPDAPDVIAAIGRVLDDVVDVVPSDRRHEIRVAANLARIVERELRADPADDGDLPAAEPARWDRLAERTRRDLAIVKPGYDGTAPPVTSMPSRTPSDTPEGRGTIDLADGLSRALGAPVSELSTSTAGARRTNITFWADGRRFVATIVPPGIAGATGRLPIGVEAAVRARAASAGVAVPRVEFASDDPRYVGAPLLISEFVPGETVPRRVLRLVEQHGIGTELAGQLGQSLARLHSIDPGDAPPGLPRRTRQPAAEALDELASGVAALPHRRPVLEHGLRWLERHLPPPPQRPAIVHRDARNGNLIVGDDGLRALLDWELAVAGGDPMEDLAWATVRMWRFGNDHLEVGGFAGLDSLVEGYRRAGGTFDAERFAWWGVARTVWWALGLAEQALGYLRGDLPSIVMAASGRRVSELEWDLLTLTRPGRTRA